jgi:hypothetical protein
MIEDMTDEQKLKTRQGESFDANEGQRALVFRHATVDEAIDIEEQFSVADKLLSEGKLGPALAKMKKAIESVFVGTRNMGMDDAGAPVSFSSVLGPADIGEIRQRLVMAMTIGGADRKKSALQLPSAPGKPASPAVPAVV